MEVSAPTELLHALLVCFIQEEVALFHSSVHFKTQAQTGILHQLRVDVMDQGLQQETHQLTQHNVLKEFRRMKKISSGSTAHLQLGVVWAWQGHILHFHLQICIGNLDSTVIRCRSVALDDSKQNDTQYLTTNLMCQQRTDRMNQDTYVYSCYQWLHICLGSAGEEIMCQTMGIHLFFFNPREITSAWYFKRNQIVGFLGVLSHYHLHFIDLFSFTFCVSLFRTNNKVNEL